MSSSEQPTGQDSSAEKIPEVQRTLEQNLRSEFGTRIEVLPSHAWTEYGLTIAAKPEHALDVFRALKDSEKFRFNMLMDVTAVDWLDRREPRFDVVYQLLSLSFLTRLTVKVPVGETKPEVPSVRSLWHSANFLEREVWDMYGILFQGHGDLRRILMYDEFVGHPLRKDYPIRGKQPRVPLRIPELRNTSADMHREQLVSLPVRPGSSEKAPRKSV